MPPIAVGQKDRGAGRRPRALIACLILCSCAAPCVWSNPSSSAETAHLGRTLVRFHATLVPDRLPRHRLVPVSLRVAISVRTTSAALPPATRSISLAVNRGGRLERTGLPTCPPAQIRGTSSRQALDACRGALIGRGSYLTKTVYPEGSVSYSPGAILAFNAAGPGGPLVLAHLYSTSPASTAHLIAFHLRQQVPGRFGTRLFAALPASMYPNGSLLRLTLRLHRTYSFRGEPYSYLSASCPLPSDVALGAFPLARATLAFADHTHLAAKSTAICRGRRARGRG